MPLPIPDHAPAGEPPDGLASHYAQALLADLGMGRPPVNGTPPDANQQRWRESGLADLTGEPDAPLENCPLAIASLADGALAALRRLAGRPILPAHTGAGLLTLRATLSGFTRRGAISPGGSCRILPCADGHVAVNLARESDWQTLAAWLGEPTAADWASVAARLRSRSGRDLIAQARILGLAVADAAPQQAPGAGWFELCHTVAPGEPCARAARVIDLSSLWAGPLCGLLLQQAGCDVVKVEGSRRPDGARNGNRAFYDFLNGEKQQRALDLHTRQGREQLLELIRGADIVIEASRPRALHQMGIHAEQVIDETPGLTWLSITGYGRGEPEANWIAYGDDAGVAAGLSAALHRATGRWLFLGDAIADPLTGMHAALAALASWQRGGGRLLSVPLVATVRHVIDCARQVQVQ